MARSAVTSLVVLTATLTIVPAAWGQSPNSCGRYLGIGWSDGYHSHTACPPKTHAIHPWPVAVPVVTTAPIMPAPAPPPPVPWWKIPATQTQAQPAEQIPWPAAAQDTAAGSSAGSSLFRQPGESSSVTVSNGPRY